MLRQPDINRVAGQAGELDRKLVLHPELRSPGGIRANRHLLRHHSSNCTEREPLLAEPTECSLPLQDDCRKAVQPCSSIRRNCKPEGFRASCSVDIVAGREDIERSELVQITIQAAKAEGNRRIIYKFVICGTIEGPAPPAKPGCVIFVKRADGIAEAWSEKPCGIANNQLRISRDDRQHHRRKDRQRPRRDRGTPATLKQGTSRGRGNERTGQTGVSGGAVTGIHGAHSAVSPARVTSPRLRFFIGELQYGLRAIAGGSAIQR